MSTHITERAWTTKAGLNAHIVFNRFGYRCGYVDVSSLPLFSLVTETCYIDCGTTDPLYSLYPPVALLHEAFNNIQVHGGVTFNDSYDNLSSHLIGFDCGHAGDQTDIESAKQHKLNPDYILIWDDSTAIVRTLDYCIDQCESLANQLNTINSNFNYIITDHPELFI